MQHLWQSPLHRKQQLPETGVASGYSAEHESLAQHGSLSEQSGSHSTASDVADAPVARMVATESSSGDGTALAVPIAAMTNTKTPGFLLKIGILSSAHPRTQHRIEMSDGAAHPFNV